LWSEVDEISCLGRNKKMPDASETRAMTSVTCDVPSDEVDLLKEVAKKLHNPAFKTDLIKILEREHPMKPSGATNWRALAPF
jgi:hypothetical protein